jgi:hypothetical protein
VPERLRLAERSRTAEGRSAAKSPITLQNAVDGLRAAALQSPREAGAEIRVAPNPWLSFTLKRDIGEGVVTTEELMGATARKFCARRRVVHHMSSATRASSDMRL